MLVTLISTWRTALDRQPGSLVIVGHPANDKSVASFLRRRTLLVRGGNHPALVSLKPQVEDTPGAMRRLHCLLNGNAADVPAAFCNGSKLPAALEGTSAVFFAAAMGHMLTLLAVIDACGFAINKNDLPWAGAALWSTSLEISMLWIIIVSGFNKLPQTHHTIAMYIRQYPHTIPHAQHWLAKGYLGDAKIDVDRVAKLEIEHGSPFGPSAALRAQYTTANGHKSNIRVSKSTLQFARITFLCLSRASALPAELQRNIATIALRGY